jgi:hypothetical protein
MVDRRVAPVVSLHSYLDYSTKESFASMQSNGPVDGFLSKVNDESRLRNQYYALGSGSQGVFVPSSNSDLFVPHALGVGPLHYIQPFPRLFGDGLFNIESPQLVSGPAVGGDRFFNSTRSQLRGEGKIR